LRSGRVRGQRCRCARGRHRLGAAGCQGQGPKERKPCQCCCRSSRRACHGRYLGEAELQGLGQGEIPGKSNGSVLDAGRGGAEGGNFDMRITTCFLIMMCEGLSI
jgi:hypothetical protein